MNVAFQAHWLEDAIGSRRSESEIADSITNHPDFRALITESVEFAQRLSGGDTNESRVIAEHIVSRLYQSMGDFTTMH